MHTRAYVSTHAFVYFRKAHECSLVRVCVCVRIKIPEWSWDKGIHLLPPKLFASIRSEREFLFYEKDIEAPS